MRKKLLALLAIPLAFATANAQTDIASDYFANPKFETLKASDGTTDVTVKTALTNGLYGWDLSGIISGGMSNYQVESYTSGSDTGFPVSGAVITPSEGTYYYFNRKGWANLNTELKTTSTTELSAGTYYVVIDYKAADYSNNNNASNNGTTMGITVTDASSNVLGQTAAVRRSYSMTNSSSNPGTDSYMVDAAWSKMGAVFVVTAPTKVTVSFVQNMKNSGRSDIAYDNMCLYKIENASETSAFDISSIIMNANTAAQLGGWTITCGNTFHVNTWSGEGITDGSNMVTPFFEDWIENGSLLAGATITETLTGLPAGIYKFTAFVRTLNEAGNATPSGATIIANQDGSADACSGSSCTNGTYGTYSVTGAVGSDGQLKIGFKIKDATINWISFKDLKLQYQGADETAMKNALSTLLSKAKKYDTNTVLNTSAVTALTTAIKQGDAATTSDAISSAISALNTAIEKAEAYTSTNIITNADFSSWNGNVPNGWTVGQNPSKQNYWNLENKALEVWAPSASEIGKFDIYQDLTGLPAGVYRICVSMANGNNGETTAANGAAGLYAQSGNAESFAGCTINATNATDYSTYSVLVTVGEDGTLRLGLKNVTTMTARWFSADNFSLEYLGTSLATVSDDDAAYLTNMGTATLWEQGIKPSILQAAKDALGTFESSKTMANYEAAQAALQTAYAHVGKYVKIDETVAYTPVAQDKADVDLVRTFNADVWNTFCVPFAIDNATLKSVFGDGVEVAEFTSYEKDGAATFTTMDEPAITANTPVIIKGATAATDNTYSFTGRSIETGTTEVPQGDMKFVGTYTPAEDLYTADESRYVVGSDNKIYATSSEYTTSLKGTRAYIVAPADANVKFVVDGAVTGIENINENGTNLLQGTIYTISGQRVNNVSKGGLYIVNGKKVLVK